MVHSRRRTKRKYTMRSKGLERKDYKLEDLEKSMSSLGINPISRSIRKRNNTKKSKRILDFTKKQQLEEILESTRGNNEARIDALAEHYSMFPPGYDADDEDVYIYEGDDVFYYPNDNEDFRNNNNNEYFRNGGYMKKKKNMQTKKKNMKKRKNISNSLRKRNKINIFDTSKVHPASITF
jgi:hypothetical protein